MRAIILTALLAACQPVLDATTPESAEPVASARSAEPEVEPEAWGINSPVRIVNGENVFATLAENDFCIPREKETDYALTNGAFPYRNSVETLITETYRRNGYNSVLIYFAYNPQNITAYRLEMISTITQYLALQGMTRDTHYELDIGAIIPYGTVGLMVKILDSRLAFHGTCNDSVQLTR